MIDEKIDEKIEMNISVSLVNDSLVGIFRKNGKISLQKKKRKSLMPIVRNIWRTNPSNVKG